VPDIPDRVEQIRQSHAGLIYRVVISCSRGENVPDLGAILEQAEQNQWTGLVAVIRRILGGQRDESLLNGLDEEDRIIIEAILRGLQNPGTLPDPDTKPDPGLAAPGIAGIIHAAKSGNTDALQLIANMATQFMQAGGDMAMLAARIRPLVLGERNTDLLCEKMSPKGEKLMMEILAELDRLEDY
jgi:hypothetical protein